MLKKTFELKRRMRTKIKIPIIPNKIGFQEFVFCKGTKGCSKGEGDATGAGMSFILKIIKKYRLNITYAVCPNVVGTGRLELPIPCGNYDLNVARLPISPHARGCMVAEKIRYVEKSWVFCYSRLTCDLRA